MQEEEQIYYQPKPELDDSRSSNPLGSVISLLLFIGLFYLITNDTTIIFLIVLVLFIHESGHFFAMKIFGYRDVNMFFVPLMGAMVAGDKDRISQFQKSIIVLAGPIPGILIGFGLIEYGISIEHEMLLVAGSTFMFINAMNLIPLDPLDGGKMLETLFLSSNELLKKIFFILSFAAIGVLTVISQELGLGVLLLFMANRFRNNLTLGKLRKEIERTNVSLVKTYNELTDKEYWQIRNIYVEKLKLDKKMPQQEHLHEQYEKAIAGGIRSLLIKPFKKDLPIWGVLLVLIVWIAGIVLPILYGWPVIQKIINGV